MVDDVGVLGGLRRHEAEARQRRRQVLVEALGEGLRRLRRAPVAPLLHPLRAAEGRVGQHRGLEPVAEPAHRGQGDRGAHGVADEDRLARRIEQAGDVRHHLDLVDEGVGRIAVAPVRAAHAGRGQGDDPPVLGEEGRDEAPPVGMRAVAVQEEQARRALPGPRPGSRCARRSLRPGCARAFGPSACSNQAGASGRSPPYSASGASAFIGFMPDGRCCSATWARGARAGVGCQGARRRSGIAIIQEPRSLGGGNRKMRFTPDERPDSVASNAPERRAMDFTLSDRQRQWRDRVRAFMDAHVYPNEAAYKAQTAAFGADRWQVAGDPGGAEGQGPGRGAVEPVHAAALRRAPGRRQLQVRGRRA